MAEDRVERICSEYDAVRSTYVDFAMRLETLLNDVLKAEGVRHLFTESRAKEMTSLRVKLSEAKYEKLSDLRDLAGVRVVSYVYEDIDDIERLITQIFDATRIDVEQEFDKVGYRSHHWEITLPKERIKLREYARFKGMVAELQIRTVLQHAWAQVGHNQIYKPTSILPKEIKRDFGLLSGLLEIADNEFARISSEIRRHEKKVKQHTDSGRLNIPIDTISLREFFNNKFFSLAGIEPKFGPSDNMAEKIIEELNLMGVANLDALNRIIPKGYQSKLVSLNGYTNYAGIARHIMILHDSDKYFRTAWRHEWSGFGSDTRIYDLFGVDVRELSSKYGLTPIPVN